MEASNHPAEVWKTKGSPKSAAKPKLLTEVSFENQPKLTCSDPEFNRVLGGGIVPGSLTLLGGEPGIGKSTLLLQVSAQIKNSLYFSAEESLQQLTIRLQRLKIKSSDLKIGARTVAIAGERLSTSSRTKGVGA